MLNTPLLRAALGVLLVSIGLAVQAADLTARVDRTQINDNETFSLQLVAEGDVQGEPDLSPLSRDFDILSRGQSKTTNIVNGRISSTREWTIELAPKHLGVLRIPSLTLGQSQSQPVTVEVVTGSTATASTGDKPLFLKEEVSERTPYVQQTLDYRIKIYFRQPPQRAALSDPSVEGATIQRVGDDRSYDDYVDGVLYRVIERRYQVTPLQSGILTITSPRLEAMVPDTSRSARRDPFADLDEAFGGGLFQGFPNIAGLGQPTRRIIERADDVTLQVRPQPAESGSIWLPATSVQIADEWTPNPPVFKVGEPVTRTLTLTVEGATSAQLPNLDAGTLEGAQVYPDQPKSEDLAGAAAPTAVKTFKIAIVPARAGTLILPEIRLPWWDTKADLPRVAVVPARTIEVAGGPAPSPTPDVQPPSASTSQTSEAVAEPATAPPEPTPPAVMIPVPTQPSGSGAGNGIWPWLAGGFGFAWLATLLWWLRERRLRRDSVRDSAKSSPSISGLRGLDRSAARRRIEKACLDNDPRTARQALILWGQAMWGEEAPNGLNALALRFDDAGALEVLTEIDRAIYAPPDANWTGSAVWSRLGPLLDRAGALMDEADEGPLPELYPRA